MTLMDMLVDGIGNNLVLVLVSGVTFLISGFLLLWCRRGYTTPKSPVVDDEFWAEESQSKGKKSIKSRTKKTKPEKGKTSAANGHVPVVSKQNASKVASNVTKASPERSNREKSETVKQRQTKKQQKSQTQSPEAQGEWTVAVSKKKPKGKKDEETKESESVADTPSVTEVSEKCESTSDSQDIIMTELDKVSSEQSKESSVEPEQQTVDEIDFALVEDPVADDIPVHLETEELAAVDTNVDTNVDAQIPEASIDEFAIPEVPAVSKSATKKKKKKNKISSDHAELVVPTVSSPEIFEPDLVESANTAEAIIDTPPEMTSSKTFVDEAIHHESIARADVPFDVPSENSIALSSNSIPPAMKPIVAFDELGDIQPAPSVLNKKKKKPRRDI